jgi:uncharacterized protein
LEFHFTNESHELDEQFKDLLGESSVYSVSAKIDQLDATTQVKGSISALIPHICSRCAENFKSKIDKKFTTLYYKTEDSVKTLSDGLGELEGSFDLEFLPSSELDLGEAFYEQLALEVPFQPLCSEDCLGLCGQCGVNLKTEKNHTHLNELVSVSPFAKLKELRGE